VAERRSSGLHAYKARSLLACAYTQVDDYKTAEPLFVQVVKEEETIFGRTDRETIGTKYLLANCRLNLGDIRGAMKGYAECREWFQADTQRQNAKYATLLFEFGHCHTQVGEYAKAASCFAEAATVFEKVSPEKVLVVAENRYNAARAYHVAGDSEQAEKLVTQAVEGMRVGKEKSDLFPLALELNGSILCERKKYPEAEKLATECADLCKKWAPGSEIYFRAKSCLGAALTGQGKFEAAKPHHLEAVNGMTACREAEKLPLTDKIYLTVLRRVIDLYEQSGKPDEAAKWKARLPKGER
jgi:tetratricopeptide (TPR) repeat protein